MVRRSLFLLLALLTVNPPFVHAQGPPPLSPPPPPSGPICQVVTQPPLLHQRGVVTFRAVAKNADGSFLPNPSFIWISDNRTIVDIDGNGVATGGSITGLANITC